MGEASATVVVERVLDVLALLVIAVGAAAFSCLGFALTTLIVALWDTHRTSALLGGTLVFLGLALLFGVLGARTLRRQPPALQDSLRQLREDGRRAGDES